jgi:hypothetical protein
MTHTHPGKGTTMNTSRHLVRAVLGVLAGTWLLVTGGTAAWAGPAPIEPEPAAGVPPAVLVTLLVTYVVMHRRSQHAAPA